MDQSRYHQARERFAEAGFRGVVMLIDVLLFEKNSGKSLGQIVITMENVRGASGVADHGEVIAYLGSQDGTRSPLDTLLRLSEGISKQPTAAMVAFDRACDAMASEIAKTGSGTA